MSIYFNITIKFFRVFNILCNMFIEDNLDMARKAAKRSVVIGQSELGRDIYAFVKGQREDVKVLIHGAIHAREYITGRLICDLIKDYKGEAEIWFVPFVNPDGVCLVLEGLDSAPKDRHKMLKKYNGYSRDFSQWKANINGVDLNVNFDADWGRGTQNIRYANYENFIGTKPFSESETRALRDLTIQQEFVSTISYHTKGEEIYWGFQEFCDYYDEAMRFSNITGYPLKKSIGSAGGYKDWFTKEFGRLGLTIEAGRDDYEHPLDNNAYDDIYLKNKDIANLASEVAISLYNKHLNI